MTQVRRKLYEFTEYYSPDGEVYYFDVGERFLISDTGTGLPPTEYIQHKSPYQHGNTIYGYYLQPRIIQLVERVNACSRIDYWIKRAEMLNILRPNRQSVGQFDLGKLRKILPDGSKRDIDVLIEFGPVFEPRNIEKWDEWGIIETLRFIAPDPTFYNPTSLSSSPSGYTTNSYLVFPFSDYLLLGITNSIGAIAITYSGTWMTYPTIVCTGPMSYPTITNTTTGETITLNYSILDLETVTMSLLFGNKTVTSSIYGNIIGAVTASSDLATFHLAPHPEALNGINDLEVSFSNLGANTDVDVIYYTRYIGI